MNTQDSKLPDELLPPMVRMFRTKMPEKLTVCYSFFHQVHGSLGQLFFTVADGNKLHLHCEVAGSEGAPMTEKRKALIMPISKLMPSQIDKIYGKGEGTPPAIMSRGKKLIESKVLVCLSCDAPVALLIFAEDTLKPSEGSAVGELEDYACLMHQRIKECNQPAWVIGGSDELGNNVGKAWVLKIWPERHKAEPMRSDELNLILDRLQNTHCAH